MSTRPVRFRVPEDHLRRAKLVAADLASNPNIAGLVGGAPTVTDVLRLAIARGLEVLEQEQRDRGGAPAS